MAQPDRDNIDIESIFYDDCLFKARLAKKKQIRCGENNGDASVTS